MNAVVLVPYRPDGAERERNWGHARIQWARLGLPIFEGNNASRRFDRACACNVAAANAGDWDVALFADADILLASEWQAREAIGSALSTGAYTVAYSRLKYLTTQGTEQAIENEFLPACETDEEVGLTWECCFAVRHDIWERVGGFDERFRGYGGQGLAFFYAAATFGGRERIHGDAYHMAHPLIDRKSEQHFAANCELAERYRAVVDDPVAMSAILGER